MNFLTAEDIKRIERLIAVLRDQISHSNSYDLDEFSAKVEEVNILTKKLESFRLSTLGLSPQPPRSVLTQEQADRLIKERLELARAITLEQSGVVHLATRHKNKLTKSVK